MDKKQLIEEIRQAFAGVELSNGIGLSEGDAIDDYADAQRIAECKRKDEREDWQRIDSEALNVHSAALSFFDSDGMRFHLPAFMIADLKGAYRIGDLVFHLTQLAANDDYNLRKLSLLSVAQWEAVIHYLQWVKEEEPNMYDEDIDEAILMINEIKIRS